MIPAEVGLAYCNKLFFLEKQFRDLTPEERKDRRQETEMQVWESFYAFLFYNIILANLTGMGKHALKQSAMNRQPFSRRKLKYFLAQQLRYSCGHNIRFLGIVLNFCTISTLLLIALNAFLRFINTDFSLDMFLGSI